MATLLLTGTGTYLKSVYRVVTNTYGLTNVLSGASTGRGYLKFQIAGLPKGAKIKSARCGCAVSTVSGTWTLAGVANVTAADVGINWAQAKNGDQKVIEVSYTAAIRAGDKGAPYPGLKYENFCMFSEAKLLITYEIDGSGGGDQEGIDQEGTLIHPIPPEGSGNGFFFYPVGSVDFARNGTAFSPSEATIQEEDNGEFSASLAMLMDEEEKWKLMGNRGLIRMPCPARKTLDMQAGVQEGYVILTPRAERGYAYLYSLPSSTDPESRNMGRVNNGERLIMILDQEEGWYRATAEKTGVTGWIAASDVEKTGEEAAGEGVMLLQEKDQIFRIHEIETDDSKGILSVTARHIFYDLAKAILIGEDADMKEVTIREALERLKSCADHPIPFSFYTDCAAFITGDFRGKNIVEALLDPESGIIAQANGHISRDNFDVHILKTLRKNRGVKIEHGRNCEGAVCTYKTEGTANRIISLMDGRFAMHDDENRPEGAEILTVLRKYKKEDGTAEEQAKRDFENGLAGIEFEMDVDFILLSETARFQKYAGLQQVFLGDEVEVTLRQGTFLCELSSYVYNAITRKYDEAKVGATAVTKAAGSISGLQVAGVNAGRILGQISGSQLQDGSIEKIKVSEAFIGEISTDAITALTARIEELAAENITTDQLYAALAAIAVAQITTANIENANIQWANIQNLNAAMISAVVAEIQRLSAGEITANQLNAAIAQIANAEISSANIDFAHIYDLMAGQAIIEKGVGGELYIARLAVTEANMVSLSVGELLLRGPDGCFYALQVDEYGNITTELKQVSNSDIADLSINGGQKIIEGSITAATLNVRDIFADSAIIREMMAANINVDTLFAREATLSAINALDIRGNEYLKISVNGLREEIAQAMDEATGQQMILSFTQGNALEHGKEKIGVTVHVWRNGEEITSQIPEAAFRWERETADKEADFAWNGAHKGMTGITLDRRDVGKSCKIRCILNEEAIYGSFEIVDGELHYTPAGEEEFILSNGYLYGEEGYILKDGYIVRETAGKAMIAESGVFDHSIFESSGILIQDDLLKIKSTGNIEMEAGSTLSMKGADIQMEAGSAFKVKSGGTADIDASDGHINLGEDFSVTKEGSLVSKTGSFANGLFLGGNPVNPGPEIIVSHTEPEKTGVIWLKPGAVKSLSFSLATGVNRNILWYDQATGSQSHTFTLSPESADTMGSGHFEYALRLPLYEIRENRQNIRILVTARQGEKEVSFPEYILPSIRQWQEVILSIPAGSDVNLGAESAPVQVTVSMRGVESNNGLYLQKNDRISLSMVNRSATDSVMPCEIFWKP